MNYYDLIFTLKTKFQKSFIKRNENSKTHNSGMNDEKKIIYNVYVLKIFAT